MARRKKQDLGNNVENHDDTVEKFIKHCFKDGQVACIMPKYGETYLIDGLSYTFTKDIRNDMVESGRVKVISENDNMVVFVGISL